MLFLEKTNFSENLIKCNSLDEKGFDKWVFYPGMLFDSPEKWWGTAGSRSRPHEGLDICFFLDKKGRILRLDKTANVTAIYGGEIVKVEEDYLGKSVYVRHETYDDRSRQLYTVYGHLAPYKGIGQGCRVKEGDIIAKIADGGKKNAPMFAHLHISIVWIPQSFSCEDLNWDVIGGADMTVLMNPLEMFPDNFKIIL
jgi:peptidase M23-like protein